MSNPYPPPRQRWVLPLILYSIILIVVSSFTTYALVHRLGPGQPSSSPSSKTSLLLPTPTPQPTIDSSNFSTFLGAFAHLLQQGDSAALQHAIDIPNFQAVYMRPSPFPYTPSDPGPYDWQAINQAMLNDNLRFTILLPMLTADQAGYSCFGYGSAGIAYINLTINAMQLQYVVGNTWRPGPVADPLITPNSTVFVFELQNHTWLWRAVTFNNALGC